MKKIILALLLLTAAGGGFYFYGQRAWQAQPSSSLTLYGNVDIRDVALGFRVSGRLEALHFEEGDAVERGAVLAVLDKKPFLEELALANAELAEAQATLANAEKVFRRRVELVKTGAVTQTDYDDALAARDIALARVATANARIDLAQTRLEDTELHAPSPGTILTRVLEPGAIVMEAAVVYTLALDSPVWVRTYIDEPHLGNIYPGQKAIVSTDSGGRYDGQIGFISPQAEFTPKNVETAQLRTDLVYRLRVIVDNPDSGLRQGMPVTVTVNTNKPES